VGDALDTLLRLFVVGVPVPLAAAAPAVEPARVDELTAGPVDGGWGVTDRHLRQTAGLCREGEVDGAVAALVAGCDGTRPWPTCSAMRPPPPVRRPMR
jgi:hypothetical protein